MCWLPRSVNLGLRGLHKCFPSLSTTLLYPRVGQVWVKGVLGCVAGGRCPLYVAGRPHAYFAIIFYLADDVISTTRFGKGI